ncbi:TIGR02453 family protein [Falsiphaeobacter marinintestinus]|uniref:TIGR02453 family protein n=1 Tax=Falsiphaeobacter marinintestinus TaxID=1492905 RepID=UPI0011B62345|nr:TIGR02453 family protein [Phaeobacter marinintestinus]
MSDPFAHLIPDARAFLADLAKTNTRDWFNDNKQRFETELKTPATLLLDQIAYDLKTNPGWQVTPKLFRPHRDVRFSKDKTPYHTHLHMLWTITGPGLQTGLFFGIAPDYVKAGGGIMAFDKEALTRWRAAIDGPTGDIIAKTCADLADHGLTPDQPDLKRVPAPYDKTHRHGDFLRRKSMTVWADLPKAKWPAPTKELPIVFRRLQPLLEQLQAI